MIKNKELEKFAEEMEKVLDEKFEKYQDGWKVANISELRTKMNEQIKNISNIIMAGVGFDKEEVKRKIVHAVNYGFFLYTKLNE